jgi:hypothetical protein
MRRGWAWQFQRAESRRCDLAEERLEEMIVPSGNHRHIDGNREKRLGGIEPGKTGCADHHLKPLGVLPFAR